MIRINLLKSVQISTSSTQARSSRQAPAPGIGEIGDFPEFVRKSRGQNHSWIFILLILIIAAVGGFYFVFQRSNSEKIKLLQEGQTLAAAETAASAPVSASLPASESVKTFVNDAVNNGEDSNPEVLAERILPGYSQWKPSRQIAFQYFSGTRLLQDLRNAAPPGVGFTRITFIPPGGFYVHGIASTEEDFRHFQNILASLPGAKFFQIQVQPVGEGGKSREFHFSGQVLYDTLAMDPPTNRVQAAGTIKVAMQGFVNAAQALGIRLDSVQSQDTSAAAGLKRFRFRTEARCDYSKLQALLEKLQQMRSGVGFQRVSLEARGDDVMAANLELLVYTK